MKLKIICFGQVLMEFYRNFEEKNIREFSSIFLPYK
jgi:hypothetical protein